MRKYILFLLAAVALAGCRTNYRIDSAVNNNMFLAKNAPVYIAMPRDGECNSIIYDGSGEKTQSALESALFSYTSDITLAREYQQLNKAKAAAKASNAKYLLYPAILNWEDRNTPWSGRKDRISIKVTVVDAQTGTSLQMLTLHSSSPWFTLVNHPPEVMLPELSKRFANLLYR